MFIANLINVHNPRWRLQAELKIIKLRECRLPPR